MESKSTNFIEEIINEDLGKGKVKEICTRFPPEPNGYLHIGHAKALCVNYGVKEKYKGKFNLRFDDTNPVKEDEEFVECIKEDIKWLGIKWDKLVFASDYFEEMYKKAELLINKGKAFVCELTSEEISKTRGSLTEPGKESPFRNRTIEENLDLFRRMREGKFIDGEKVLRAKINMSHPNMNMRDPVVYRILHTKHHNTGDKWCIYPMYDFAHPLEDAIEGITHSLCSLEFEDHRPLYDWYINECEFERKPRQIEFARLNLTDTVMSKRFLKQMVDSGSVEGWDDPRMPTLAGMRRRGYPAKAIVDFCQRIGIAKANSEAEFSYLEAIVREHLNESAKRVMAVTNPIKVVLSNYFGSEIVKIENNPNDDSADTRDVSFSNEIFIDGSDFMIVPPPKYHRLSKGGYVRLKGAYIIKCEDVVFDKNGNIEQLLCNIVEGSKSGSDTSNIKVKGVIQWVDARNMKEITLKKYGKLLNEDDGSGDLLKRVNKNSLTICKAYAESILGKINLEEKYQFMRMGYFVADKSSTASNLVYNEIVGLKDSYNK